MQAASVKETSNRKKALGRGLAALIANNTAIGGEVPSVIPAAGLRMLSIEKIKPNKKQPRKTFDKAALEELSASIKQHGILQPIVVRRASAGTGARAAASAGDHYEIVAGERRWRAASLAGVQEMPAVVKDYSEAEVLQIALIENIQRHDLDPLEEAESYHRLIEEYGLTHEEVAAALSKNRSTISNALRLLKLPKQVLTYLAAGQLTAGHARALMILNSDAAISKLAGNIVDRGLSVRDAEHLARQMSKSTAKNKQAAQSNSKGSKGKRSLDEASIEERLQQALGTKVRLHHRRGKGHIEISFHSFDELDGLLDRLL